MKWNPGMNGTVMAIDERILPAVQQILSELPAGEHLEWDAIEARLAQLGVPGCRAVQSPARQAGAVAIVPVQGVLWGKRTQDVRTNLRAALANSDVKAVVLDIDSPGGVVYGIDELATEIYEGRSQKPIVAQVQPFAASAAYYLASQAHEIAAGPTAELGSIGVWTMHEDWSKFLDEFGVKVTLTSAGKYKTEGHPFGPLDDEAKAYEQSRVDDYYGMFVAAVARGRGRSAESVRTGFGEGRVVGARQAVEMGMADRIGTMEQTLARLDAQQVVMPAAAASAGAGSVPIAASTTKKPNPASAEKTMEVPQMSVETNTAAQAGAAPDPNLVAMETKRASQITTLAHAHGCSEKAAAWIQSGKSVEAVQAELLGKYQATALPQPEDGGTPGASAVVVTKDEADKVGADVRIARIARALSARKGNCREAAEFARTAYGDPAAAKYLAMAASTGSQGGFMIPEVLSSDFIELLRPMTAVRSLNPTLAPLVNGALTISGMATGATGSYIGEQQNAPKTDPTVRQVKAAAKKLAALVPISNDLVRYASQRADSIVSEDLRAAVAVAEDSAFIRGPGTTYTPKGLLNWAPSANKFNANGTITLDNVTADLKTIKGKLEDGDVRMLRPGWIMNPRSKRYLEFVRDGNGNFAFQAEIQRGLLLGYPFRTTTLVPKNLGGGSDESEIYFADFADVVIADVPMLVLEVSSEATYHDGSNLQSAFSRDETVVKIIVEHDLVVRHTESVAVMQAVKWS